MQIPPSSTSSSEQGSGGDSASATLKKPLILISLLLFMIFFLALTAGRLIRFEFLCNRALECVLLGKPDDQPFRANASYSFPEVCGDIPVLANRPEYCVLREETFITDSRGYRNAPSTPLSEYRSVVFGDSFAYGQGNTQSDRPAAELSRVLGEKVYDGAGKTELRFLRSTLEALPQVKRMYYLHLERHPRNAEELDNFMRGFSPKELSTYRRWYQQWKLYNPIQILATRFDKWLRRNGVFPNHYAKIAPAIETATSGLHLFLKDTAHLVEATPERLEGELAFFKGLRALLKERGIELTVVLIPEKYAVYHTGSGPLYLDSLSDRLRQAGHTTVHLLPRLREEARKPIELQDPVYWRDDTHWAPRGIRLLGEEVSRVTNEHPVR